MTEHEYSTEEAESAADGGTRKPRRKRGTGFPVVPLSEAARILKEAGKYGFEHPTPTFASHMGHSSTNSGTFRLRLSAFRYWGLITGRGDTLTMTEVARQIAIPPDLEPERRAMQEAFSNCEVFARLHEQSAKGQPLDPVRLAGRAVHELGVAPAKASKFVESFIESALAAELAERNDDGEVVLWEVENNAGVEDAAIDANNPPQKLPAPSTTLRRTTERIPAEPTIRQAWPIEGGEIVLDLRSVHALPASAFAAIGEVVAKLEDLAGSLAAQASTEPHEEETEA